MRLHIYPHNEPNGIAYIVGEPSALRKLAATLLDASRSRVGIEDTMLYTSDGHSYNILVISDVSDAEWQTVDAPYTHVEVPEFETLNTYNELRSIITTKNK